MAETYVFQDYVKRTLSLIGDGANKLTVTEGGDVDNLIRQAVNIYSEHKPHYVKKTITSDGTDSYNINDTFGVLWSHSVSRIERIEYPTEGIPPNYLEQGTDWYIYDSGATTDGSSLYLKFIYTPAAGENFIVEFRIEMSLTREGGQNFFHNSVDFTCITYKAAELCFLSLSAKFAQTFDATISADSVQYSNLTRKYQELAKEMRQLYNKLVFGSEDAESQVKAAMLDVDLDLPASDRRGFLFH